MREACENDSTETIQWLLDNYYTVKDVTELIEDKNISKKIKEKLKNYQPVGLFTKPANF